MIYEYRCPEGHMSSDFVVFVAERKQLLPCELCGEEAHLVPSLFQFRGFRPQTMDTAKQCWEGTKLEDSDGNEGILPDSTNKTFQVDFGNMGERHKPAAHKRRGIEFAGAMDS